MSTEVIPVAAVVEPNGFGSVNPRTNTAIVERTGTQIISLSPNPMDRQFDFWTSLPEREPESKSLVLKAMSSGIIRGSSMLNKPFAVSNAVCHPVELEDEKTGEVTTEIRMVLIMPSGEMVSFVSRGAFKALGLVARLYGPMPWSPPLTLMVTQYETRKGRRSYNIEVVASDPPKPSTGRRRD